VPVLLFSVIAHEYAHGYAALKQGDTTALMLGRLTWNPIKHIDPFMTIILPLMLFLTTHMALGGAKPVPVNPRNYRNVKRGDIIVSLAGVTANLALVLLFALLVPLIYAVGHLVSSLAAAMGIVQAMMILGIQLNLLLIAFNLIPIPPLDGSHVMKYLLPPAWSLQYQRVGFVGIILLILVMRFAPGFLNWWFAPADYVSRILLVAVSGFILPSTPGLFR